jgi:hypothetical protein
MKKEVGLWIDRRKAVIVTIENEVEVTREIRSNIDKHLQPSGTPGSKAANLSKGSTAEDKQDKQLGKHLGNYYEGIISFIREADSIWIIGPDKAKHEFEDHLKRGEFRGRIEAVEPFGKMSDSQIAAKVRNHFQEY